MDQHYYEMNYYILWGVLHVSIEPMKVGGYFTSFAENTLILMGSGYVFQLI